jgi:hypothetical protein
VVTRSVALVSCFAFVLVSGAAWGGTSDIEMAPLKPEASDATKPGASMKPHNDVTVVPYAGGDSDIGFGGGAMFSIARLTAEYKPYLWRFESVSLVTFKADPSFELPYIDGYARVVFPHVIKDRMTLELRLSYTREDLKYFGLGNASKVPENVEFSNPVFAYRREHPTLLVHTGTRLAGPLLLLLGVAYTQNWLTIPENTLLAQQRDHGTPRERESLGPSEPHGVFELSYGLGWDDRDNSVSPEHGQYHTVRIDLDPGGVPAIPQRWARLNTALRFYVPLVEHRLTFAVRALTDVLFGDPPFYELQRYDDTSAIGGANGVRGVPGQRYYGKIKVFANFELRSRLFDFRLFGHKNTFGLAAFTDVGRLWSGLPADPQLDGHGLGLKLGVGGGVRIYGGKSFVVRADIAWSPDARPVGGYLAPGEIF